MNSNTAPPHRSNWPVNILAAMMFLIPAVGVPNEYMLQDTLKSAIAAFGILLAALVFFWDLRKHPRPLQWHWVVLLPAVLCLYALGSMVWSHTYLAGVEAVRWFLVALLVWLVLNTMGTQTLQRLLWGIHWGAFVASLWAALQYWFDWKLFPQVAAPASTFVNRNFFAEYTVSVLPLSVYLLLSQRYTRWLILFALSLALNFIAILMTGTRSALLALAVIVPFICYIAARNHQALPCWRWAPSQRLRIAVIFLAACAVLGAIPSGNAEIGMGQNVLTRSSTRSASLAVAVQGKDNSFSTRVEMWKTTARMLTERPVSGVGAGAWEAAAPLFQPEFSQLETDYYAHNDHLQLLSEYGYPVGGGMLAVLVAAVLQTVLRSVRLNRHLACVEGGLIASSVVVLLVVSSAGFPLHLAGGTCLLAVTLGSLCAARVSMGMDSFHCIQSTKRLAWAASLALGCLLVVALGTTYRAGSAEYRLTHAIETLSRLSHTPTMGSSAREENLAAAKVDIQEAIRMAPHYRKLLSIAGDQLIALGEWSAAVPIWETISTSRPHVPAVWSILALSYSRTHHPELAMGALQEVQRLRPHAIETTVVEIQLLIDAGAFAQAAKLARHGMDTGHLNYDLIQLAYQLGYQVNDLAMSIQAMDLRNQFAPSEAPDGFMRLGKLYADPRINDNKKALAQFALGLQTVPVNDRANYLAQIPERFRLLLDNGRDESSSSSLGAGNRASWRSAGH